MIEATKEKFVLITGATGGIGREISLQLAERGWTILLTGRNEKRGKAFLRELQLRYAGKSHALWLGDLSVLGQVRALANWAQEYNISALVNNAGGVYPAQTPLLMGYSRTFLLNLIAPWLLTNLLLPQIAAHSDGRLVNLGSSLHYLGQAKLTALANAATQDGIVGYAAIKLALLSWTFHLAQENLPSSVTILAADPGIAATDNFKSLHSGPSGGWMQAALMASPDYRSKREAAKSIVAAVSDLEFKGIKGKCLAPEGGFRELAASTKKVDFRQQVNRYCAEVCQEFLEAQD